MIMIVVDLIKIGSIETQYENRMTVLESDAYRNVDSLKKILL